MKYFNNITKHKGSVILAVLSMATLSSIALFTMMFSIKSLSRTLTLESVQNNAQQLLLLEHNKTISSHMQNPSFTDFSSTKQIIADGMEYTYKQNLSASQARNSPLSGFSINSNYGSRFLNIKSLITAQSIQSPTLHTGIACVDVINEELNSDVIDQYELKDAIPSIDSLGYEFDSTTGEIWRNTVTTSKLIIDFNFESHQRFSRADFAMLKTGNKTRFALIFSVTEIRKPGVNQHNNFYVLFDRIGFDQTIPPPLSTDRLITLTPDYSPNGDEDGFIVPLSITQIQMSAITTINNTIIFIKQLEQPDPLTGQLSRQNTLYQINLSPDSNQTSSTVITTRLLSASVKTATLKTTKLNQAEFLISTQAEPGLYRFPIYCKQVFQYEE